MTALSDAISNPCEIPSGKYEKICATAVDEPTTKG